MLQLDAQAASKCSAHVPLLIFDEHVVYIVHVLRQLGGQEGHYLLAVVVADIQVPVQVWLRSRGGW